MHEAHRITGLASHLRLITQDGRPLKGARKAARSASRPTTELVRVLRDLDTVKRNLEHLSRECGRLPEIILTLSRHGDDPMLRQALLRELEIQARYTHRLADNAHFMCGLVSGGAVA